MKVNVVFFGIFFVLIASVFVGAVSFSDWIKTAVNGPKVTGYPVYDNCIDSDGGIYEFLKGEVMMNSSGTLSRYTDYCFVSNLNQNLVDGVNTLDSSLSALVVSDGPDPYDPYSGVDMVKEYYCASGVVASRDIECTNGCFNGACIPICTDSDDGLNFTRFGQANGPLFENMDSVVSRNDFCFNSMLTEYYCLNGFLKSLNQTCQNGCSNGVCLQAVVPSSNCTDSDGGINYNVSGMIYIDGQLGSVESCLNQTVLLEYYCGASQSVQAQQYVCQNGCSNGVCLPAVVPSSSCTDSDGGKMPFVFGSMITHFGGLVFNHSDSCALGLSYNVSGNVSAWQGISSCSGGNCYVEEAFCRLGIEEVFDFDADELIRCEYGCNNGRCLTFNNTNNSINGNQSNQTGLNCTDNDGYNIFIKGNAWGSFIFDPENFVNESDSCINSVSFVESLLCSDVDCGVIENYCFSVNGSRYVWKNLSSCANGCFDGACVNYSGYAGGGNFNGGDFSGGDGWPSDTYSGGSNDGSQGSGLDLGSEVGPENEANGNQDGESEEGSDPGIFIKLLCKIVNLFNSTEYKKCVIEALHSRL